MNRPAGSLIPDFSSNGPVDQDRTRARPLLRRYEAIYLDEAGNEAEFNRLAPANSFFETAFNAFARGVLISTPSGPVAIEDLHPGDLVETAETGAEPVLWRGSLTLYPIRPDGGGRPDRLYRVTADALGYGRPMQDLLLGPGAQLWSPRQGTFVEADALVDGDSVVELNPPTAVTAYHLCLANCATLLANGVALRSYAPDQAAAAQLAPDLLRLFLDLFPNRAALSDLNDLPENRRTPYQLARAAIA